MPRPTRRGPERRHGSALANMTDADLFEVAFFGNLMADPHTTLFRASAEQQAEARRLLAERGAWPVPPKAA